MGQGYEFKCECGYSFEPFLGIGFMFPTSYREAVQSARKGKFGKEIQTFLAEHPEGKIDAEVITLRCTKCGEYKSAECLDMYLPKGNKKVRESAPGDDPQEDYIMSDDLKEHYSLYAAYRHKCKCGGDMETVDEDELLEKGIVCPRCGRRIINNGVMIMWD